MIKKLSKSLSKALRFVNYARSSDSFRPVLQTIKVEKGFMMATDGRRLHAIKLQPEEFEEGLYELESNFVPNQGYIEIEKSITGPENYPNFTQAFPQEEPAAIIRVNVQYLIEALSRSSKGSMAVIKYYAKDQTFEVFTVDDDGIPGYALIMPMSYGSEEYWRPPEEESNEPA